MPSSDLKKIAVNLISENLGEVAAETYDKFYQGESDELVLSSLRELLTEVLGEKKAEELIKKNIPND